MQEGAGVDHYARHEELFKKRLALLRESLALVEQRRRLTRERPSSPAFKSIILRLKQSQADAQAVKGKNQKLLQAVDDMLIQKQAQLAIKPTHNGIGDSTIPIKVLCGEESVSEQDKKLDGMSSAVGQKDKAILKTSDLDLEKQHQVTSHIKLQDLGSASKSFNTEASCLLPITSTISCQKVTTRTSEKPAQHDTRDMQAIVCHQTAMPALQPVTLATMSTASISARKVDDESAVQDRSTERNRVGTTPENTNERGWLACSSKHSLEDDFSKEHNQATSNNDSKEQESEQHMHHHEEQWEQGEQSNKQSFSLCARLERSEAKISGDGAPSRFLIAGIGNQLHDQDRTLIKRKREELAVTPSKEKLRILDNIYNAIHQWENTLWAYESEQAWNPSLVFSTIEAARGGDEEVKELLRSRDSGSRLLICCEAVCELMHSFPPESLVPMEFVKECLLAASAVKSDDIHEWAKNNLLTTYQDVDSAMFWDSLTRHALYLVTHELATAKQIASVFSGILLPASRLKDTSKGQYESAKLTLHIFIAILLGAKDAAAACSWEAKGCISNGQDCQAELVLYKDEGGLEMQERDGCDLMPIVKVVKLPTLGADEANDELSSNSAAPTSSHSCLSCTMLVRCLPWKKSKGKSG